MTVTSPAALLSLLEDIPRHLASRHGAWLFVVPAVLCAAILGVIRNVQARRRRRNLPLPPGPKGLPILGNLLQIPFEYPWKMYAEWKKQYGDIIYLEALGQKILVLNSLETIEALLVKRAANYSDRSWSPIIDLMRSGWSFSVMNYGAEWRDRRRLFHQFFHDLEDHRPVVQEELLAMLRDLIGRPKEYRDVVRNAMGIIIMRLTYGAVDKDYNKRLIHAADTAVLGFVEYSNPGRMWVNIIPSMRFIPSWFPGAWWKRELLKLAKLTDYLHQQPFADATKRMKEGTQGPHTSFATKLIQALPEEGDPERARQETLARDSVAQAYTAGADTMASAAYGLAFALASYPEVQRKAQEELDRVVGPLKLPTYEDIDQLPYLQAIVRESHRWHVTGPLALPHLSRNDDSLNGYFIPANTLVLPNSWAVLHDPKVYPEPHEFKPERFLKDGELNPDVQDPSVAAFGYGRRICPGRFFGNDTFTFLAAQLISCFDVKPFLDKNGNQKRPNLESSSAFISIPLPFEVEIVPRSPQHVALLQAS